MPLPLLHIIWKWWLWIWHERIQQLAVCALVHPQQVSSVALADKWEIDQTCFRPVRANPCSCSALICLFVPVWGARLFFSCGSGLLFGGGNVTASKASCSSIVAYTHVTRRHHTCVVDLVLEREIRDVCACVYACMVNLVHVHPVKCCLHAFVASLQLQIQYDTRWPLHAYIHVHT